MSKFQTEIAGGSLHVGSPETVATKLAAAIRLLGLTRFDMAYASDECPTNREWRRSTSTGVR
jgi:alkanesulfonate monooxygenase SsuD/methylene tetrahydromethanopterin reductase-like flavin-dependent oxidoreductase (luciferase family)